MLNFLGQMLNIKKEKRMACTRFTPTLLLTKMIHNAITDCVQSIFTIFYNYP